MGWNPLPQEETIPMSDSKITASETVLAECPGRALVFLKGVAANRVIHAQLAKVGFTKAEYQLGWKLLHAAAGYTETLPSIPERSAAFEAMEEIDGWDEDGFRRIRSALERLHPAQAEYVFAGGLAASTGAQSVIGVKKLLDRLRDLESGKGRKATHKDDLAALDTLTGRGFDTAERERLRALVETAQTLADPDEDALPADADSTGPDPALVALYGWYKDWSNTAHSVIKKRSHLITLGLAERRPAKKAAAKAPKGDG